MTAVSPFLRYHGAKWRLAPWIIAHFPHESAYQTYVEPFGGSAAVLLRKPRSYAEVYNDLDSDIVNLFRVMRDRAQREELIEAVQLTPYARDEFNEAYEPPNEPARTCSRHADQGLYGLWISRCHTGLYRVQD